VQQEAHEAAPDVAGAEVDGLHPSFTADSRA
jgi:hypothetical protein